MLLILIIQTWEQEECWKVDLVSIWNEIHLRGLVQLEGWVYLYHVSFSMKWSVWISRDRNHFQDAMYLIWLNVQYPNGPHSLDSLASNKVLIDFLHVLHAAIDMGCFLVRLESCIRLKGVSLATDNLRRWVPWWLHMSLIKKTSLDIWHRLMT